MKKWQTMKRTLALAVMLALPTFMLAEDTGLTGESYVPEAAEVETYVPEAADVDLDVENVDEIVPEAGVFSLGEEMSDAAAEGDALEIEQAQEPAWVYFWVEPENVQVTVRPAPTPISPIPRPSRRMGTASTPVAGRVCL